MPAFPGKRHKSRSKSTPGWLWGVIVVATGGGLVLAVIGVGIQWRQCRGTKGMVFGAIWYRNNLL